MRGPEASPGWAGWAARRRRKQPLCQAASLQGQVPLWGYISRPLPVWLWSATSSGKVYTRRRSLPLPSPPWHPEHFVVVISRRNRCSKQQARPSPSETAETATRPGSSGQSAGRPSDAQLNGRQTGVFVFQTRAECLSLLLFNYDPRGLLTLRILSALPV
uniref:Uncharacterized protein n=1 Tax=Molossus molossus TaxID=27622 RepID=A0A7J8C937_MOLMO|nr:hypothetical protein HJG59_009985 [Molossus molossus]